MKMKVAVCEDERHWRLFLESLILEWAKKTDVGMECCCFSEPNALFEFLRANGGVDAVFLDIYFGDEGANGFAAAKAIREAGSQVPIIFVTADPTKAIDGYIVEAMGYISKPIDEERLALFLGRALKLKGKRKAVKIKTWQGFVSVRVGDIAYCEVRDHTVTYHTANKSIEQYGTLYGALELLGKGAFVQVHQSYIVAIDNISSIKTTRPYSMQIKKGHEAVSLPVGRTFMAQLEKAYFGSVLEATL